MALYIPLVKICVYGRLYAHFYAYKLPCLSLLRIQMATLSRASQSVRSARSASLRHLSASQPNVDTPLRYVSTGRRLRLWPVNKAFGYASGFVCYAPEAYPQEASHHADRHKIKRLCSLFISHVFF